MEISENLFSTGNCFVSVDLFSPFVQNRTHLPLTPTIAFVSIPIGSPLDKVQVESMEGSAAERISVEGEQVEARSCA